MISKLTPQQESKMAEYVNKYVEKGLSTEQASRKDVVEIVNNFYVHVMNKTKPDEVVIKDSPYSCWKYIQEKTKTKMNIVWPYLVCQFDSYKYAFYDFFINEIKVKIDDNILTKYKYWRETLKLGIIYPFDDVCIVSKKPTSIYRNSRGLLHNENGPALTYSNEIELWFLNGVKMLKEHILTPWNKLDCKLVVKESNVEVRRELVRKIGIERIYNELGATVIDKETITINNIDHNYELISLNIGDNNRRPYLKMTNPSIGVFNIEGVHPNCTTVRGALEYRNNTKELPIILT